MLVCCERLGCWLARWLGLVALGLVRFVDGLSLEEIADVLGLPVGTVKSRLHNALTTLRKDERTKQYFGK